MPSSILARADALMQRRRNPDAGLEDVPVLTDAVIDEEDFPVLRDIETPPTETETQVAAPAPAITPELPDQALAANVREILAHELARRVEQRLAAELPRIIEATVRDYLAEQATIDTLQARD